MGRRINTNKKNERNIKGEIDTEVINFEVLEREFLDYIESFILQCKKNLNIDIKLVQTIDEGDILSEPEEQKSL